MKGVNEGGVEGCGQEGTACKCVLCVYMTVHSGVSLQKASNSVRKWDGGVCGKEMSVQVLAAKQRDGFNATARGRVAISTCVGDVEFKMMSGLNVDVRVEFLRAEGDRMRTARGWERRQMRGNVDALVFLARFACPGHGGQRTDGVPEVAGNFGGNFARPIAPDVWNAFP